MKLLEEYIKGTQPALCRVNSNYAEYLYSIDNRISSKWSKRTYVGLAVSINGMTYVVPLTSQTTEKRAAKGHKKRQAQITTFIKDGNVEIANLLHNNMFPAPDKELTLLNIDPNKDTYMSNEIRYIRKHWVEINNKSIDVYMRRCDSGHPNYSFYYKMCCDFKALEEACRQWDK